MSFERCIGLLLVIYKSIVLWAYIWLSGDSLVMLAISPENWWIDKAPINTSTTRISTITSHACKHRPPMYKKEAKFLLGSVYLAVFNTRSQRFHLPVRTLPIWRENFILHRYCATHGSSSMTTVVRALGDVLCDILTHLFDFEKISMSWVFHCIVRLWQRVRLAAILSSSFRCHFCCRETTGVLNMKIIPPPFTYSEVNKLLGDFNWHFNPTPCLTERKLLSVGASILNFLQKAMKWLHSRLYEHQAGFDRYSDIVFRDLYRLLHVESGPSAFTRKELAIFQFIKQQW